MDRLGKPHVTRCLRQTGLAVLLGFTLLGFARVSWAQTPGGAPDLNDLALLWSRGSFAAPLLCEFDGRPERGLRRIEVEKGPTSRGRPTNRMRFIDLEPGEATRCFDTLGTEERNVIGSMVFALPGRSRPDTAQRDFESALKRENGFEFEIRTGSIEIAPIGASDQPAESLSLAGGTARIERVKRGSDAHRLLAEFPQPRKFTLLLRAPSGEELKLRFVQLAR